MVESLAQVSVKLTRREMDLSSDRPSVDADLKARIRMAKGCRGIHSICTNVVTGLAERGDGIVVSTTSRPIGMDLVLMEMRLSDCGIHTIRGLAGATPCGSANTCLGRD